MEISRREELELQYKIQHDIDEKTILKLKNDIYVQYQAFYSHCEQINLQYDEYVNKVSSRAKEYMAYIEDLEKANTELHEEIEKIKKNGHIEQYELL